MEKLDVSAAALPDFPVKRIFIGGVSAGVTAGDMEKTFSPLGRIHTIDFIHSNCRNFAFMDFEPNSVKSLAKLFSTYNGCTWKGGKLKLEIAKEHYLARLRREWAEDAKLASAPPPTKESFEFERSHCSSQENSQIRIFFPNLRKVKPLPFKGTGKHKYSFQRVDVPPLPIHFCDCEEHSKELEATSQKYLSPLSTVMHEKERNIITNVINKLMGGDKDEIPSDKMTQISSDPNIGSPPNEDLHLIEAEVSDADDDNLVMNIGIRAEDDILMQLKEGMTQLVCQESGIGNPHSSKGRLVQDKANSSKRKKSELTHTSSIMPNKRSHLVSADGPPEPEPAAAITQKLTSDFSTAESGPAHAPKIQAEMPSTEIRLSTSNAQPAEGQSWLQKSSWKDLVGGRGSSSFSISNILSGLTSASSEIPKANASDTIAMKNPDSFAEKSKQKIPQNTRITSKLPAETPNAERQNRPSMSDVQPAEDQSWQQKSSWKDLVGGSSSISFSISNVLPSITLTSTETPKAIASDTVATKKTETFGEKSEQKIPQNAHISPGINPEAPISTGALEMKRNESSSSVLAKHNESQTSGVQEQWKEKPEFSFGEVCPFMRNAESEQQWLKAKSALSGYLKKNSNEGNASKFSKGKQPSRR